MPESSVADRFAHILSAIGAVEEELHGISEDMLANDRIRRLALERLLEIISVASNHIPPNLKTFENGVDWKTIADIGDRLENTRDRIETNVLGGYRETSLCRSEHAQSDTFINRIK